MTQKTGSHGEKPGEPVLFLRKDSGHLQREQRRAQGPAELGVGVDVEGLTDLFLNGPDHAFIPGHAAGHHAGVRPADAPEEGGGAGGDGLEKGF